MEDPAADGTLEAMLALPLLLLAADIFFFGYRSKLVAKWT
jgi:hypothetical protein